MKPFVLGLTGGTGCGKSTAAAYFKENGARIIDADAISRSIMEPGHPAFKEVTEFFQDVLLADGTLNRKKLASIVFGDKEQLHILNTITHKYIHDEIIKTIKKAPAPLSVIDAPLLFEANLHQICDKTLCILADNTLRIKRIITRDALTETEALARIGAQKNDDYYKSRCDFVVYNKGSLLDLECALSAVLKEIFREG